MKRKVLVLTLLVVSILFTGCSKSEQLSYEIEKLEQEKVSLEQLKSKLKEEVDTLQKLVVEEKINKNMETYLVVFKIKQTHLSLDIADHIKDDMNALEITIPVSQEYYESIEVGQIIDDSFRGGSFWMKGSVGAWEISVANKSIE